MAFGASFGDGCADQCAGQFFMCMKNFSFRFIKNIKMVLIKVLDTNGTGI